MGRPKAGLELGGESLLSRVLKRLTPVCREVILVTRRPSEFLDFNLKIVRDLVPGQGPLGGLATGLFYAHHPWVLTLACDLPFVSTPLLAGLAQEALAAPRGPRAIVPRTQLGWQPLCAVYSRACLPPARRLLAQGRRKVDDLIKNGVSWQAVTEERLRGLDPDLVSFININTPKDLEQARAVIKAES